tara:strand:- start:1038 stop:1331 length:294 start_codon:yes stop_codon:yes gene_type:complete
MNTTENRIQSILDVPVPKDLGERADMWNIAYEGEIVNSSTALRAIAMVDILESTRTTADLLEQYGHIIPIGYDTDDDKVVYIISQISMKQIATFIGY